MMLLNKISKQALNVFFPSHGFCTPQGRIHVPFLYTPPLQILYSASFYYNYKVLIRALSFLLITLFLCV